MTSDLFDFSQINNPQGPGFVMGDYTREQAVAGVGPGWAGIVGDLWDYLKAQDPPVTIHQVKEKFGGLRCYVGGVPVKISDAVYARIDQAEALSYGVCETCGQPGVLRGGGWLVTACDEHSEGRGPIKHMDDELGGGDDVE